MGDCYQRRREDLKKLFKRFHVEAFLVTDIKNVRYLTGFSGSAGFVFLCQESEVFITDFRYEEQSRREVQSIEIFIADNYLKAVRQFTRRWKVQRVGFEASQPYKLYESLKRFSEPKAIDGLVERLRVCKDEEELVHIKEAVQRAERAFLEIKPFIRAGKTEREIALRLEEAVKRQGSTKVPFEFIVASGPNSAMPHARPSERRLGPGDLVVIDWGAESGGYFSDMTRTLLINGPDRTEKIKIYEIVKRANELAIEAIRPDISASDIDTKARDHINSQGYLKFFRHSTGHGVGLDVHEPPKIAGTSKERVKKGMIFTIEPGIYIPGLGGVRIEDMVYVNERPEVLTTLTKDLEIIG